MTNKKNSKANNKENKKNDQQRPEKRRGTDENPPTFENFNGEPIK